MATDIRFTVYGPTLTQLMDNAGAYLLDLFRDWNLPGLSIDYDLDVSFHTEAQQGKAILWRGDVHARLDYELSAVGLGSGPMGRSDG